MFNKSLTLSNGVEIPQLALGTWLIDDDKVGAAVNMTWIQRLILQ